MTLRKKTIDGETVFRHYWEEMGGTLSLSALAEHAPRNTVTGERITKDAYYKAMWRWACRPENEKDAYRMFRKSTMGKDPEWTPERWHAELAEKARWALTRVQYKRWYNGEKKKPAPK